MSPVFDLLPPVQPTRPVANGNPPRDDTAFADLVPEGDAPVAREPARAGTPPSGAKDTSKDANKETKDAASAQITNTETAEPAPDAFTTVQDAIAMLLAAAGVVATDSDAPAGDTPPEALPDAPLVKKTESSEQLDAPVIAVALPVPAADAAMPAVETEAETDIAIAAPAPAPTALPAEPESAIANPQIALSVAPQIKPAAKPLAEPQTAPETEIQAEPQAEIPAAKTAQPSAPTIKPETPAPAARNAAPVTASAQATSTDEKPARTQTAETTTETTPDTAAKSRTETKPPLPDAAIEHAAVEPRHNQDDRAPAVAASPNATTAQAASHTPTPSPNASAIAQLTPASHAAPLIQQTMTTTPHAIPLAAVPMEIAAQASQGKSRFEIRLDPAELGRIDVRIDIDRHGQVTSRLTVERSETLELLRRDAPQLERALQDAGLKTGDSALQFSLRDQSSTGRDGRQPSQPAHYTLTEETIQVPEAAARLYGRVSGAGGVDIRV